MTIRGVTAPNRLWVAPMCQYSAVDGVPNDWHLVHLGGFAKGRSGLVMTEATAVNPEGRISPGCLGLWDDEQKAAFARITRFIIDQGSTPAIQLAHAGRKASTPPPWERPAYATVPPEAGGWQTVGPSALSWGDMTVPRAMSHADITQVVADFAAATRRANTAGFEVVEIHAAHGYLIHQFLSPLSNTRTDEYGGDLAGRSRLLREIVAAVRDAWPQHLPLFLRISATDWVDGGWDIEESIALIESLQGSGIDLIDVSSGGLTPDQVIPVGPGYQVPFARRIREATGIPVAAVGLINESSQAEQTLADGAADAVFIGRNLLRDPMWPLRAAKELGVEDLVHWPDQYRSAKYRGNVP
ncbi:NADH:flavin oxidoreductase/NADH oxidase [Rhodococcus sp. NPDC057014]|uniref:NADH:flavin oxidoreductase/NADH oxidase n=1 Tax=Rhodococcus sp. NPDC057014 TaxID=3346000 RepID=UPI00363C6BB2